MKPIYYGILAIALFCVGQIVYGGNATPVINTFNCFSSAGGKICAPTSHSTIKVVGAVNTPGTETITITPGSIGAPTIAAFNGYTSAAGGRATRAEVNSGILSMSSSPTAPTTTSAHNPFWCDTSTTPPTLRIRNGANTGWIPIGTLTDSGLIFSAANADNATNATNAGNASTVGGYTPSLAPGVHQISVNDANGFTPFADYSGHGLKTPTRPGTDNNRYAANMAAVQSAIAANATWTTPTFSAGNFIGGSNIWTVTSGNVGYNRYYVVGKRMHWILYLTGTSVTSGSSYIILVMPNSATGAVASSYVGSFVYSDNGTYGQGIVNVHGVASPQIWLYKNFAGTNWAASTGNTAIVLNIEFEIQ